MAKARSRTAARKIKDKWKSKVWYNILAPPSFDNVTVADTLSDNPDKLMNRVTEVSLQDITNDFRKSHIKLFFKVNLIDETNAHTHYVGHTLTSDYLRRMIRRKRSKIDGVYDVKTRDGAIVRVKPFATTDKRIQNSQKKVVRQTMKQTISTMGNKSSLNEFIKVIIDGKMGSDIYKNCKKLYPVKRVEIFKTQVLSLPTVEIDDEEQVKIFEQPDTSEKEEKEDKKDEEKKEEKITQPDNDTLKGEKSSEQPEMKEEKKDTKIHKKENFKEPNAVEEKKVKKEVTKTQNEEINSKELIKEPVSDEIKNKKSEDKKPKEKSDKITNDKD